jgi:hypothetical protein
MAAASVRKRAKVYTAVGTRAAAHEVAGRLRLASHGRLTVLGRGAAHALRDHAAALATPINVLHRVSPVWDWADFRSP